MSVREDFYTALKHIDEMYSRYDESDQRRLYEIIDGLASLSSLSQFPEVRSKALRDVSRYIHRKTADPFVSAQEQPSLRHLRNQLVHGRSRLSSTEEVKQYSKLLWRILTRSAPKWRPSDLYNVLAYCLGARPEGLNPEEIGPAKIVRMYKAIFDAMEPQRQAWSLNELISRLYSDKAFRSLLENAENTR